MRATGGGATNEAIELAERAFGYFNAGDFDAFWDLQHPEIVMATDRRWPGGGTYEGVAGFRQFLDQFLEAFETVRFEKTRDPEPFRQLALFGGRWVGAGATTGIEAASVEFFVIFGARDGRIDVARFFFDEDEAREFAASR